MFNDYQGLINLDSILLKEYNYTFNGNYENLYKQPFIELEGNGVDAMFWIEYQGDRYLFKPLKEPEINIWGELLSQELAKYMGLPCAQYRACTFSNLTGVITKSIIKDNETLIIGSEIFQYFLMRYPYVENEDLLKNEKFKEFYQIPNEYENLDPFEIKKYVFNYLNNLEHIWSILASNKKISPQNIVQIMINLKRLLIFDIITLQGDRHHSNWAIIANGQTFKPAPIFDNTISFGLGYFNMANRIRNFRTALFNARLSSDKEYLEELMYEAKPNLTLSPDNTIDYEKRIKDTHLKVLEDYLNITDDKTNYTISKLIAELNEKKFNEMVAEAESKNGIKMPTEIYEYISNLFLEHLSNLKGILKEYWRFKSHARSK